MRPGGGHAKGAAFERDVCRHLSRFVDPHGDDTLFWRSSLSGGRATVQNRKGGKNRSQLGDLTCVHEAGHWLTNLFTVECKFYASLQIESSLLFGKGLLADFWRVHCKLARKHDRHPILIAKQNRRPALVLFDAAGLHSFRAVGHHATPILECLTIRQRTTYVCFFDEVFTVARK